MGAIGLSPYPGPTGAMPVLQVHPLRRCNLSCAHCYTSSSPRAEDELPLRLLCGCLNDAAKLGYQQLAVSGGEPLMYPALAELLAHARGLAMTTTLTSNGTLATERRWERLAPLLDVLAISIDGRPAEHDALRRRAGAFAETVAHLPTIRASGVPFGFIFTLTQHNVDSLEFVVRLAAEHGARSVQAHPLTLHGRAATLLAGAHPDGIELEAALLEASRLGAELGVNVHVDALTVDQLRAHRECLVPPRPIKEVIEVAPVLIVEPDGSVLPLTHEVQRGLELGSLHDTALLPLAQTWLWLGQGDVLAEACERTWAELTNRTGHGSSAAVYWYEEVAARTKMRPALASARPREFNRPCTNSA